MEKQYKVIKPAHGYFKGECKEQDYSPTIDTGIGKWHILIGEVMEEIKCEQVGMLMGEKWEKMHDIGRRMSPTIDTRADCLGVVRNFRIRKLTPTECFTLQGVKPADIKLIQPNQSNSSQYHLAGDSICCSVLVAIFAKMFGKDSTQAVNDYLKDIFGGENGREQTPLSCELETNKSRAETRRKNNCKKL